MRTRFTLLFLLAAAALCWGLLAEWLPSGSERFYLLVPPVAVAGFFVAARGRRILLRRHLPFAVVALGYLGVFAWGVAWFCSGDWRPGWRTWTETGSGV